MLKTALYTAVQPLFGERVYNGGKRCNHKRSRRASNSHDVYSRAVGITGIRINPPVYCKTSLPAAAESTVLGSCHATQFLARDIARVGWA